MSNATKVNFAYYAAACFGVPGAWIVVDTLGRPGLLALLWRWYGFFVLTLAGCIMAWCVLGWLWSLGQGGTAYKQWQPVELRISRGWRISAGGLFFFLTLHLVAGCVANALLMGVQL